MSPVGIYIAEWFAKEGPQKAEQPKALNYVSYNPHVKGLPPLDGTRAPLENCWPDLQEAVGTTELRGAGLSKRFPRGFLAAD